MAARSFLVLGFALGFLAALQGATFSAGAAEPQGATATKDTDLTHILTSETPYYTSTPAQARPPDGTLKVGTKVKLLQEAGSYVLMRAETGITVYVEAGSLVALPPEIRQADDTPGPERVFSVPLAHSSDLFPIVTWDRQDAWSTLHQSVEQGLQSVADCHFTVAGFVRPEDLPVCEKLGLAAIVAPSEAGKPWFRDWKKLSDEDIDLGVKSMVEKSGNSKAVIGYAIMDEPGTAAFPKLAKAVAAVKKYAPGKLAHINLFPNYATLGASDTSQLGAATYTEYLERFVTEVKPQFLGYDNYMVEYSDDLEDGGKAGLYYANLLEVRRVAQQHALPFWNVVCCNQIRKFTTIPSPANLAFQAYTTLAAGGRGITWYRYHPGGYYAYAPIDNSGHKTETWQYLQAVNQQARTLGPIMNRLTSTGVYFTSAVPEKSLPLLPGRIIKQVQSKASPRGITKAELPVMVGEFSDEHGNDYVMLVNLSLKRSTNIKLETVKPYQSKQVFSAVDGRLLPLDEQNGHWLVAGQGMLVKLQ